MIPKKTFLIIFVILFTSIVSVQKGAKAIYSSMDVSKTSQKYETYSVDFKADKTPPATYWSLAYWDNDITDFNKYHPDAKRAGAYAGLQTKHDGSKQAIMSFWDVFYTENGVKKKKRSKRIYPPGEESTFDNEGEGTNYFPQYNWLTSVWYRFVIHSWVNTVTKKTYVGEWIENLNTKEWTLLTYFDVGLNNSFLVNGFGFFIENYDSNYFGKERNFQLKNMYIFDHSYQKWISINTTTLSSEHHENSQGTHEFGYTSTYFYGSCGLPVEDQEKYDASMPESITGTIRQPDNPDFESPVIKSITASLTDKKNIDVSWVIDKTHPPCSQYTITLRKKNNGQYGFLASVSISRPESKGISFTNKSVGVYSITVKCTSILHTSSSKNIIKTFE
jgi:hypothetical protein